MVRPLGRSRWSGLNNVNLGAGPSHREHVRTMFGAMGALVAEASARVEALHVMGTKQFDLVVWKTDLPETTSRRITDIKGSGQANGCARCPATSVSKSTVRSPDTVR